jgi:hypothetical protein
MVWTPIDGRALSVDEFKAHVEGLNLSSWKPIGVVWHNTAAPTLVQWKKYTRQHWMESLASYYKGLGWSAGPHMFIDDEKINLFTPLTHRGVHSPSFNAQYIGIEHVGDYAVEDDDSGPGLNVKNNGIAATAILCAHFGIPADTAHIKLHKQDPRTTHDCPGKDMADDYYKSVQAVVEYMGTGGEHAPDWGNHVDPGLPAPVSPAVRLGYTLVADLNLRESSSASSRAIVALSKGRPVTILGQAQNGNTLWFHVKLPDKNFEGWVAARYVQITP